MFNVKQKRSLTFVPFCNTWEYSYDNTGDASWGRRSFSPPWKRNALFNTLFPQHPPPLPSISSS